MNNLLIIIVFSFYTFNKIKEKKSLLKLFDIYSKKTYKVQYH